MSPNTLYYYQLRATNSVGTVSGLISSFTTNAPAAQAPTVTTGAASAITTTSATLGGTVNPNGANTTYIFLYGTNSSLSGASQTGTYGIGAGTSTLTAAANIASLSPNTLYYYQLRATNSVGTVSGLISSFTTNAPAAQAPTVTTGAASAITTTSATLGGTVNPNGANTTYIFLYGTNSSLSGASQTGTYGIGAGTSTLTAAANIASLSPNTLYYYQLRATNSVGTVSGLISSFTTNAPAAQAPTVTTGAASAITTTSATLGGTVNPNGANTTYIFLYGTNSSLSGASQTGTYGIGAGTSTLTAAANIASLSPNTLYYYQLRATNSVGTVSGLISSFTTNAPAAQAPTVTTGAASAITTTSATLGGTVNPNGANTTYIFLYGTNSSLSGASQTGTYGIGAGTSTLTAAANIASLSPNTLYYYQLRATNSVGTVSGLISSFTTNAPTAQAPTVTTGAASAITTTSATLGGTVNPNGANTTYIFLYGTNISLSGASQTGTYGIGAGTSTLTAAANIASLSPNTLYYYQLRATNSVGTVSGLISSFTTNAPAAQAPTVTTGAASAITTTSATLGGTVNPNGANTTYIFLYGTNSSLSGASQTGTYGIGAGTSTLTAAANIASLSPNTLYYYQLRATNSVGTVSGLISSFTTNAPAAQAPTVTTGAASAITTTSATLGGTVNPNGADTTYV